MWLVRSLATLGRHCCTTIITWNAWMLCWYTNEVKRPKDRRLKRLNQERWACQIVTIGSNIISFSRTNRYWPSRNKVAGCSIINCAKHALICTRSHKIPNARVNPIPKHYINPSDKIILFEKKINLLISRDVVTRLWRHLRFRISLIALLTATRRKSLTSLFTKMCQ